MGREAELRAASERMRLKRQKEHAPPSHGLYERETSLASRV